MQIAILNDTHWGARNDNGAIAEHQHKFYREVFFPYLRENNIKTIFHLGDVTDRRKYINFVTAKNLEEQFMKVCADEGIELYMIAGNHDTYFKNTNSVNSLRQLYGNSTYGNLHLYWDKPVELDMDGCKIMLAPWICPENYEESMQAMNDTKAQILMGHFEITGYEMDKGHICDTGMDRKLFSKFDSVYSGHFHQPSSHGNISYLGAQYEMTWADHDQKRGFSVFDTDTRKMTYVRSPLKLFHKIMYDDNDMTIEDVANLDTSLLTNTFIKVIVKTKENPYIFDLFLDRLQQAAPADIKVVDDHQNLDVVNEDELIDEAQDTMTILRQYVDNLEIKGDKLKIQKCLNELYQEAMNL
jgi:DNA repair exonuclease SbcCD nuclease subunit